MNDIQQTYGDLPEKTFERGDILIEEGAVDCNLLILQTGEVEIIKCGVRITVVSTPGAFFGEVSMLLGEPAMATVRAVNSTTVRVFSQSANFLAEHPAAGVEIARLLAKRLGGVTNYLVDLRQQFSDQKNHLAVVDEILGNLLNSSG
ncbi:MAG: Crp/Fnr family transcriptional regulator [Limisphaerales bacterium]